MADGQPEPDIVRLIADHHKAVYRYAYRLTGSVQDAEDLAQQVFFIAQRKLGQLRNVDAAGSWLLAILRNCFLKDRQRQRPALARDLDLDVDLIAEDEPPPEKDGDRLQRALDRLPDLFRVAVLMFYFEECSYREIADRLEIPIGTVMSRLARAREHLRAMVFDGEKGPGRRPHDAAAERGLV